MPEVRELADHRVEAAVGAVLPVERHRHQLGELMGRRRRLASAPPGQDAVVGVDAEDLLETGDLVDHGEIDKIRIGYIPHVGRGNTADADIDQRAEEAAVTKDVQVTHTQIVGSSGHDPAVTMVEVSVSIVSASISSGTVSSTDVHSATTSAACPLVNSSASSRSVASS